MRQFVKPIWGVHSTRNNVIVGASSLTLAADATRYHSPGVKASRMFVTADTAEEARKIAAAYEWQTRGYDKGVQVVTHAATGLPVLMAAPRW